MAKTKYSNSGFIYSILNTKLVVLLSNVIFQGSRYMELGELLYKLSITIFFSLFFFSIGADVLLSIVVAHLVNYIFNGQFFVVYRYLFSSNVLTKEKVSYIFNFSCQLSKSRYIKDVLFIGSLCRNELKRSSDIDIRIFHHHGLIPSLYAYTQATKLRYYGMVYKIPVDVFCFSDLSFLNKIDKQETPLHINGNQEFKHHYPKSLNVFDITVEM